MDEPADQQSEIKAVRPQNRHLKPCKPGERRNPKGRPKGENLTTKLRRVLDEGDPKYGTKGDALIAIAVAAARKADFRFFKEIIDRMDGKVPERVAGADGQSLRIEVVFAEKLKNADDPVADREAARGAAARN